MHIGIIACREKGSSFLNDNCDFRIKRYRDMLKTEIESLISSGAKIFSSLLTEYEELEFFEVLFHYTKNNDRIFSEAIVQCAELSEKDFGFLEKRKETVRKCNYLTSLSLENLSDSEIREQYLIEETDLVVLIWDGEETEKFQSLISVAKKHQKRIVCITF